MNEKKVNRMLLYLIGFLCGHSAIVGMHPFMVPMLIAVYYMRQSTFGLFTAMLFGGAALYGGQGWNMGQIFRMGPYVMGMGENSAAYFLIKYSVILVAVLVCMNLEGGLKCRRSGGTRTYLILAGSCGLIIFVWSFICGMYIFGMQDAVLMALFETVISVGTIPVFQTGTQVLLLQKRERERSTMKNCWGFWF